MILYFTVKHVENKEVDPLLYEKLLEIASRYRRAYDLSSVKNIYMVRVYRDYLWKIKIDPTKIRPSHEALLRRAIRTGEIPRINAIVDAGNYVSLKHLVPIGIYDLDRIIAPLTIRLSIDGEAFYPIGSNVAKLLPRGYPILADQEKPIHVFPYRDSKFTAVSLRTSRLLVVVAGVEGVPETTLYSAARDLAGYLEEHCSACGVSEYRMIRFGGGQ